MFEMRCSREADVDKCACHMTSAVIYQRLLQEGQGLSVQSFNSDHLCCIRSDVVTFETCVISFAVASSKQRMHELQASVRGFNTYPSGGASSEECSTKGLTLFRNFVCRVVLSTQVSAALVERVPFLAVAVAGHKVKRSASQELHVCPRE